jgi:hypothetical protein
MKKLIYITAIVFITACKKTPDRIYVSGKAVDATTNAPLPNTALALGKYEVNGYGYTIIKLEELRTDAQGNYSFEFKNDKGFEYHIAGKVNEYYDTDIYENKVPEQEEEVKNFNIKFIPTAYLKVKAVKIDTSYNNLKLNIGTTHTYSIVLNLGGGNPSQDSAIVMTDGNRNNALDVVVTKYLNGNIIYQQLETYSIFCPAHDTANYQLNY